MQSQSHHKHIPALKRAAALMSLGWALLTPGNSLAQQDQFSPEPIKRCGWYVTQGDAWLIDSDGPWPVDIAGQWKAQGARPAIGTSSGPNYWVATTTDSGYGCVCMMVSTSASHKIQSITSIRRLPLKACRRDTNLHEPTASELRIQMPLALTATTPPAKPKFEPAAAALPASEAPTQHEPTTDGSTESLPPAAHSALKRPSTTPALHSGYYDNLYLAVGPNGQITGIYDVMSQDAVGLVRCQVTLEGRITNLQGSNASSAQVLSTSDEQRPGLLQSSPGSIVLTIAGGRDHVGCKSAFGPNIDSGLRLKLIAPTHWTYVATIARESIAACSDSKCTQKMSHALLKGDAVGVLQEPGDYAHIQFHSPVGLLDGWVPLSALLPL